MTDVKPSIQKGVYRHYKGNLYQVIDVVRHSESLDWLVLYHPLYGDQVQQSTLWVRPFAMFVQMLEQGGECIPRFAYVGDDV
ncbi:hypothetical protein B0681_08855 [Moraxella porci DSM 25326]|uniref:DUF1653 domain-containing protein n=1 Tax=Moraxella porci DSM 25326 TaxID=573983 RepID=A0A1T0CP16_9GAMM|nr:DUF1653 domain-containing protein [Moraxella porci]OOS24053.1 hypothetical protein B0681_08855 [Moraxella porci DSM 25326]